MTIIEAWSIVQSNVGESGTYVGDECRDALNMIDDVVNSHARLVEALQWAMKHVPKHGTATYENAYIDAKAALEASRG